MADYRNSIREAVERAAKLGMTTELAAESLLDELRETADYRKWTEALALDGIKRLINLTRRVNASSGSVVTAVAAQSLHDSLMKSLLLWKRGAK
jgi:hypothetical protein